jgi:hypothetical protein
MVKMLQRSRARPQRNPLSDPSGVGMDLGVSIVKGGNSGFSLGTPGLYRDYRNTTRAHPNRIYVENNNYLANFGYRSQGYFDDFRVRIYVIENGKFRKLGEGEVDGPASNVRAVVGAPGLNNGSGYYTGTTIDTRILSPARPNATYGFRVCARSADGRRGPFSPFVTYNCGATIPDTVSTEFTQAGTLGLDSTPNTDLAAPGNVQITETGGFLRITHDAVAGAFGYYAEILYDDPALLNDDDEDYLAVKNMPEAIPQGALAVWEGHVLKTLPGSSNLDYGNSLPPTAPFWFRSGFKPERQLAGTNSEWVRFNQTDDQRPATAESDFYLRCNTGHGEFTMNYGVGHTLSSFYWEAEPDANYKFRLVARAASGRSFALPFTVEGAASGASGSFLITDQWQEFEHSWVTESLSTMEDDDDFRRVTVSVPVSEQIDIAVVTFWNDDYDEDDLLFHQKDKVRPGMHLRDHMLIKPGEEKLSKVEEYTNRAPGSKGWAIYNHSIYSTLRAAQINNMIPHLQVEFMWDEDEARQFVDYLGATVDNGNAMALKRQAQGQTAPWVDEFDYLIFENGNEPWLGSTRDGLTAFRQPPRGMKDQITGQDVKGMTALGYWYDYMQRQMEQAEGWQNYRNKTVQYVPGRTSSNEGEQILLAAGELYGDVTCIGAYFGDAWDNPGAGGTFNYATETVEWARTFMRAGEQYFASRFDVRDTEKQWGRIAVYEGGAGFIVATVGTTEQITDEISKKSRMGAVQSMDQLCYVASLGYYAYNWFALQELDGWCTHSSGQTGYEPLLMWGQWLEVWDYLGRFEATILTTVQNPVRTPDADVPALAAYELKSIANPARRIIVALNRNANPLWYGGVDTGREAMTINTSIASCTSLSYWMNGGPGVNMREHNRYRPGFRRFGISTLVPDPLSVSLGVTWTAGAALPDATSIQINDTYGASATGLDAGNCVLIRMDGCVDV